MERRGDFCGVIPARFWIQDSNNAPRWMALPLRPQSPHRFRGKSVQPSRGKFGHSHRQNAGHPVEIQDEKTLSSESGSELILSQTFHPACGDILDTPDTLGNSSRQTFRSHHALHEPTGQLKPFLRRKLKSHFGNVTRNHTQSLHKPCADASEGPKTSLHPAFVIIPHRANSDSIPDTGDGFLGE